MEREAEVSIYMTLCHSLTDFHKYSYSDFVSSCIYKGREGKGELRALLSGMSGSKRSYQKAAWLQMTPSCC